jgi:hypothetical protein
MKPWLIAAASFLAGFSLWVGFSLIPLAGGAIIIREAWDQAPYWQIGVPLLVAAQTGLAAASRARISWLPLWTLAGHFTAMFVVRPWGADSSLLPLALVFIGTPAYGALLAASWLGRNLAKPFQRS